MNNIKKNSQAKLNPCQSVRLPFRAAGITKYIPISGNGFKSCLEEIWEEFPGLSQYEVRSALAKCGLTTKHIESKVKVLSGGEQAKVRLCKLINRESNLLLLDEPTNHLDVDAKAELKRALLEYKGSILMVCHEPEFYDGLATAVWDCTKWTTRI